MTDSESTIRTVQLVEDALEQLEQYFAGIRHTFTLPLVLRGTEFQKAVWEYLLTIPYGETRSYGDVARAIGREKAVRAVGQANRANPVPIVVPCHRVIGQTGALTGYAGSQVHLKAALLNLEQEHRLVQSGA
ncbi:methylated-DNA--[protein]-cysteine S-methyltransferase [Alicyclobacillus mengziensis]|uniref:Methylated-DNA--protein-cysteine methyltransferase n=2 Tax=Alicyclobacillus mengziensis TaxID=2931921 RepID=A0A9X7W2Z1_9BACL|nr:methylated-DNA--[protein]-cysteine S-methyltransferase [Alicyclobacillus mengziensis]